MSITNFRGDLTDAWAETKLLLQRLTALLEARDTKETCGKPQNSKGLAAFSTPVACQMDSKPSTTDAGEFSAMLIQVEYQLSHPRNHVFLL